MRIVHYINSTATAVGGPARFALDAARLMADAGHDFTLLSWDTSGAPKEWLDDGHSRCSASKGVAGGLPSVCAMGSPRRDFMFGMSAMRSLRDHLRRADVLHLHGVFDPSNVQVAAIAKAMGAEGIVVDKLEDVGPALKRAIDMQMNQGKTCIVEIMCTRELGDPFRRDALAKPVRLLDKYRDYV